MSRFFLNHSIRFVPSALSAGLCFASCAILSSSPAHADEFSPLPPGDSIAAQLAVLAPSAQSGPPPAALTRYEVALQTARVLLAVQNRDSSTVSRAQWRAIASLCSALKNELRQLGVDVTAARALAAQNLKPGVAGVKAAESRSLALPPRSSAFRPDAGRETPFLKPDLVVDAPTGVQRTGLVRGALEMQVAPRLNLATRLQTTPQVENNVLGLANRFSLQDATANREVAASQTALSYSLSRYLTLRAANSRLNWNGTDNGNPLLNAPIFANARGISSAGGGATLNVGAGLKFSTEIERLRADTGALASRIGGGASLSAFQDRLSLNMSLSRLSPQDQSILAATAAEVGASLDVSPRLSLNLKYQGLFAPIPGASASRVAGGVSLSF